jgi:hypothetical protein
MKVAIFRDDSLPCDIATIASHLNRLAHPPYQFRAGTFTASIRGRYISATQTYSGLSAELRFDTEREDMAFLFTTKPYDNNYFFESYDPKFIIVSLSNWERLTTLARNNGIVYLTCALLARTLQLSDGHRIKNTGCINDFWADKTGIDMGMRGAFICDECRSRAKKPQVQQLNAIRAILDDVCAASRGGMDICSYWDLHKKNSAYDVFICYNTDDKRAVAQMNKRLQREGVVTWMDSEQLRPGHSWQEELDAKLPSMQAAAVFVGDSGMGPWQQMEVKHFLQEFVRRKCPVIPVILSECKTIPKLPYFLTEMTWVDFRQTPQEAFQRLVWESLAGSRQSKSFYEIFAQTATSAS